MKRKTNKYLKVPEAMSFMAASQPARQPDRQTDRQTYRQTDRQTDRQTERSTSIRYLPSAAGKLGTEHPDPVQCSLNPRCLESGPSV